MANEIPKISQSDRDEYKIQESSTISVAGKVIPPASADVHSQYCNQGVLHLAYDRKFVQWMPAYIRLVVQMRGNSLKAAWPEMRAQLEAKEAQELPEIQAEANEIRKWFAKNDSALSKVENLNLSHLNLFVLPLEITQFVNLRVLDLSHNQIGFLSPPAFSALPCKLELLKLDHNQISVVCKDAFNGLTKLRSLNLANNQIVVISPDAFEGLNELLELCLKENRIISELTSDPFKNLCKLSILDLGL